MGRALNRLARWGLLAALCALLLAAPASAAPANDDFAGATISGGSGSVSGSNVGATKQVGEPNHAGDPGGASVWWSWTAPSAGAVTLSTAGSPFDTLLAVYTGSAVGSLTLVGSNDDVSGTDKTSRVAFTATAGTVYRIAVDGWRSSTGVRTGAVSLAWSSTVVARPANDDFAGATITGASGSVSGSNVGATKQVGEPNHAGDPGGASIWWSWTAPSPGVVTLTTAGSTFDTLLAVYTGSAVGSLTYVGSNDDVSGTDKTSRVAFNATAGTVYRIAVDGLKSPSGVVGTGSVTLVWTSTVLTRPANDDFARAEVLSAAAGQVSRTNVGATKETGEPNHAAEVGGASIWFQFTAPASGDLTVSTAGSPFDTLLAVYTGSAVGSLTYVASSDDVSGTDQTSFVRFTATAGTTYRIAVDGFRDSGAAAAAQGTVILNWSLAGAPPTATKLIVVGDIAACDSSGDEATAALVDGLPGVTVQTLGDNVYPDGAAQEFSGCYEPSWGRFRSRTMPAIGNHEYQTPGATGYFGYFGAAAGDPAKGYYSYDVGGWHVVVLNSECWQIGGCYAGSPQETWLRADLAAKSKPCTMAVIHRPLFTSGLPGPFPDARPLYQALYSAGADVVFSGHAHTYERFAPQTPSGALDAATGLRQFVVGTGGAEHHSFVSNAANTEARDSTTFGILVLTLRSSGYDWSFQPVAGASFTDSGSGVCH